MFYQLCNIYQVMHGDAGLVAKAQDEWTRRKKKTKSSHSALSVTLKEEEIRQLAEKEEFSSHKNHPTLHNHDSY